MHVPLDRKLLVGQTSVNKFQLSQTDPRDALHHAHRLYTQIRSV